MKRVIIRSLSVREAALSSSTILPPGTVVPAWAVVRQHQDSPDGPYLVHFHLHGRHYTCPLVTFQPRTEPVPVPDAETAPVSEAVAV